ncbi:dihydropteroate synthase [Parapedobacter lycopersici]|uniref:dihydropteroate synthase n=1 Tax=Parapedobacter lycopersici TaxID=1864939 RepID=UPI0033413380
MRYNATHLTINAGGRLLDLSSPKIMGILNVTPDSFFDGGRYNTVQKALAQAEKLVEEGADLLDVGAFSTRPNAEHISTAEEISRLIPVVKALHAAFGDTVPLSVDTFRSEVARRAVEAGANIINDISGGTFDEAMFATVAELNVPYILMHARGTHKTMHQKTDDIDIVREVALYFGRRVASLQALGVKDIILDPGPGFGKTMSQNFELLNRMDEFHIFGCPLLGAVSRKSLIYKTLGITAEEALNGTTALHALLLNSGVQLLRVHDVKAAKEVITLLRPTFKQKVNG